MSLRRSLIRLAHEKPEIRKDLLPLLKRGGYIQEAEPILREMEKELQRSLKRARIPYKDVYIAYNTIMISGVPTDEDADLTRRILRKLSGVTNVRVGEGVRGGFMISGDLEALM